MADSFWLGVDLGGTKILAGLFDDAMKLVARVKIPTGAEGGSQGVFDRIIEAVATVRQQANVDSALIRGMGIGLPGQIDANTRTVRYAPNLDWRDVPLTPMFPPDWHWPVFPENDVKMGTWGEFTHGAARGAKHVVGIFVGTGVGGGLILNGELYSGFNFNAGEIGHTIIHWRKGTELEAVAGRRYAMRRATEMLADSPKRVRKEWKHIEPSAVKSSQLAELYSRGDPVAVTIVDDAARALGAAVGSVVNLLSPEIVVLGGGVTTALGDHFLERIWQVALRYTLPAATAGVKCVMAELGDDAGIVGAAAFARKQVG